ncbi:hypothetical protein [Agromyces sp. GXS1127]|uniref:hypothetical protein n=1 Tax=Agromyces sp. GXS1127 TaxID=3424181 RepID=UPI003D31D6A6
MSITIERVPAKRLRIGDIIMESPGHPVILVRRTKVMLDGVWRFTFMCRYVWQSEGEWPWRIDPQDLPEQVERIASLSHSDLRYLFTGVRPEAQVPGIATDPAADPGSCPALTYRGEPCGSRLRDGADLCKKHAKQSQTAAERPEKRRSRQSRVVAADGQWDAVEAS